MKGIKGLKIKLALALDDNLHTKVWHNYVDYGIIFMILLSTVSIFISTFPVQPCVKTILYWIDLITLIFFTFEVSLRIWVAPEVVALRQILQGVNSNDCDCHERNDVLLKEISKKEFLPRVKPRIQYCFSFFGLIDILSTYPFYLQWLFPLPVVMLKVLRMVRVCRIMRIGRFSKSSGLWIQAFAEKKTDLWVSFQFLSVATIILSLLLFFAEHDAQPEVFNNGIASAIWAFAQYIGDPGDFASTPPITIFGKIIASIVGLLGIAIFAIPTGIFGSGFADILAQHREKEKQKKDAGILEGLFTRSEQLHTRREGHIGFWECPPSRMSLNSVQLRSHLGESEIMNALNYTKRLRLNTDSSGKFVIEMFEKNKPYGCYIDRGSEITICLPSSFDQLSMFHFGFYLSLSCGFNFMTCEDGDFNSKNSYYCFEDEEENENAHLQLFLKDLKMLGERSNAWIICLFQTAEGKSSGFDSLIHFVCGGKRGDEKLESDSLTIEDVERFKTFYTDISKVFDEFKTPSNIQRYAGGTTKDLLLQRMKAKGVKNIFSIGINYTIILENQKSLAFAQEMAHTIATHLTTTGDCEEPASIREPGYGYQL